MIRLLRDQIINLALKPEIELGVQSVLITLREGKKLNAFVHDFEYLDTVEKVNPSEISKIEVINY